MPMAMEKAQVTLPSDREVKVTRSFKAALPLVYRAYTEPALVQRWLLGPPGWSMPVCEMDVRVGGRYRWRWRSDKDAMVSCETQADIDRYWEKLSAVPAAEQCGWVKDKYGLSWQIVPTAMNEMMEKGTPEQLARVTQAFLKMKKFDIVQLQEAFDGNSRAELAR